MCRSFLFSTLTHQTPLALVTAHVLPPEEGERGGELKGGGLGIKVATFPGEIQGCGIVKTSEHVKTMGLLPGDRYN